MSPFLPYLSDVPRLHRPLTMLLLLTFALLSACASTSASRTPEALLASVNADGEYKEASYWQPAAVRAQAARDASLSLSAQVPSPSFSSADAAYFSNPAVAVLPEKVPDDWWRLFKDPVLDELETRLVVGNENLKSLLAQVTIARAALEASQSALFPTLSTSLNRTRSGGSPSSTALSSNKSETSSLAFSANASWEVDLWGRLAQASQVADAKWQASADDLSAARLSAQATLAQTYFSLRTADAQQSLLARSIAAYQRGLDLTRARYDGGVVGRSDVLQAQSQLNLAQAERSGLLAQRAQLEHALAVLLGLAPSAFSLAVHAELPDSLVVPQVPHTLPATLLQRRPDIAAAQRRVVAAYAQIGVSDAAFFPALTLSASTVDTQNSLAQLIRAPQHLWSLGAALTQVIFDGGARRFASVQAQAQAEQASSAYRQTVLSALQEVEDNLVLAEQLQAERRFQQAAWQAAEDNLAITLNQYRAGSVAYLNVVLAQTAALSSERQLLDVRNRQLAAINLLLKNIAGRWSQAE
ncbi:MAG: efflux transporter outer membrane subunit [Pseudomonadota bacterium]